MSDPQGVLRFLEWASDIPELTVGYIDAGNRNRFKMLSDNDFTFIDNSTEYNLEMHGKIEKYKNGEDYVFFELSEEDWRKLYDEVEHGDLDIDLPEESEIGL
jgi:hypothetical protein